MSRSQLDWLKDILVAIKDVREFTEGINETQFLDLQNSDKKTWYAICQRLAVIGEAIKNISSEIKENNENVEWKEAAGFRDILVHQYFRIDKSDVWDTITGNSLFDLANVVEKEIENL